MVKRLLCSSLLVLLLSASTFAATVTTLLNSATSDTTSSSVEYVARASAHLSAASTMGSCVVEVQVAATDTAGDYQTIGIWDKNNRAPILISGDGYVRFKMTNVGPSSNPSSVKAQLRQP